MTSLASDEAARAEWRLGMIFMVSAYLLWGFLPVYYKWTGDIDADIIVAHRILWSVLFLAIFLGLRGRLAEVRVILANPQIRGKLTLSALIISVNWLVFIWAIDNARILEISFGYFANPLVSVAIGMVVLKEQVSGTQKIALTIAALAVGAQGMALGTFPWVAMVLAVTFAIYGYIRKMVPVGASPGLMVEALLLSPLALGYLLYAGVTGAADVLPLDRPGLFLLLAGTGIVTAVPLALFAGGARRLPLTTAGLLQYLAPSLHLLMAVYIYHEPISTLRLATFVLIWLSLALFTADAWRRRGRVRPEKVM